MKRLGCVEKCVSTGWPRGYLVKIDPYENKPHVIAFVVIGHVVMMHENLGNIFVLGDHASHPPLLVVIRNEKREERVNPILN